MKHISLIILFLIVIPFSLTFASYPSQSTKNIDISQASVVKVLTLKQPDIDLSLLNDEFSINFVKYGEIYIINDITTAVANTITDQMLEDSNADVLYLPNIIGQDFDANEQRAIVSYVSAGHGIVASHGTLEPIAHAQLAPLFGINSSMISSTGGYMPIIGSSGIFNITGIDHPLFGNIPNPYESGGDATMSALVDGQSVPWSDDPDILLYNGTILTTSTDNNAAIIYVDEVNTRSVYFSHYPESNSQIEDYQLIYNSLIWCSKISEEALVSSSVFYDSFDDYLTSLEDNGYFVNKLGDPNMIALKRDYAAYNGSRGLYIKSSPNGAVNINKYLGLSITENVNLSLYVYNHNYTGYFRISFISTKGDWMSLDYGGPGGAWEPYPIFDVDVEFPVGQWYHLSRNLFNDIEIAITHADSPYDSFIPERIDRIEIFQDGDGLQTKENYFDEIRIIDPLAILSTTTTEITLFTSDEYNDPMSFPDFGPEFYLAPFAILALVVVGIIYFGTRQRRIPPMIGERSYPKMEYQQPSIDYSKHNNSKAKSRFCGYCGNKDELYGKFCGSCGKSF